METANNGFNKGLNLDIDHYIVDNNTYVDAQNVSFTTNNGNEFILSTAIGNSTNNNFKLNDGYYIVGHSTYDGIAYIASYSPTEERGEIGSFPSPNGDVLENKYRALTNYYDHSGKPNNGVYGDFNSDLFEFNLKQPVEIHIQPSYDRSVNLIIVGENMKPLIINSRFKKTGSLIEVADREGKDDNLYNRLSFSTTMRLFPTTTKIPTIVFNGVLNGGNLPNGNYKYYFKLATQDENETDVLGHSHIVSVYNSTTRLNSIKGSVAGANIGAGNNKKVKFNLSNLDTEFSHVNVYYSISEGDKESTATQTIYKILKKFPLTGIGVEIEHKGTELIEEVSSESFNINYTQISSIKTACQLKNRLFLGNLSEPKVDVDRLVQFAKNIKTESTKHKLSLFNGESISYNTLSNSSIDQNSKVSLYGQEFGWNAGYANPKNIYHKLGYHSGETYAFGVVFIMRDGSQSPVIPIRGKNNINDDALYYNTDLTKSNPIDYSNKLASGDDNGENIRGLFRFPEDSEILNNDHVNIQGLKLLIPSLSTDLRTSDEITNGADPIYIEDLINGFFFVRAERKKNRVLQGYLLPSMKTHSFNDINEEWTIHKYPGKYDSNYWDVESNYKNVPSLLGMIESDNLRGDIPQHNTVLFPKVSSSVNSSYDLVFDRYRMSLFSNDLLTSENTYIPLIDGRKDLKLYVSGEVNSKWSGFYKSNYKHPTVTYPYIIKTASLNGGGLFSSFTGESLVTTDYVLPHSGIKTINGFSSLNNSTNLLSLGIRPNKTPIPTKTPACNLKYESYIGVKFEERWAYADHSKLIRNPKNIHIDLYSENESTGVIENYNNDVLTSDSDDVGVSAYLINLYDGGKWDFKQFVEKYSQIDTLTYTPISKTFSIDDINNSSNIKDDSEEQILNLGDNYSVDLFGGDCYVGIGYRNLFTSSRETTVDQEAEHDTLVGHSMVMVHESDTNPYLREESVENIDEVLPRSFAPLMGDLSTKVRDIDRRFPESREYNSGYTDSTSAQLRYTSDLSAPSLLNRYPTRVVFTNVHENSSFKNNYRVLNIADYKDYDQRLGNITKLMSIQNRLLLVQEHGISILPINERIQTGQDVAGAVYLDAATILPPIEYTGLLSDQYGSNWQFSIVQSPNYVYGVDASRGKIWRVREGLELISDYKIQSELSSLSATYDNKTPDVLTTNVITYYNPDNKEVIFNYYNNDVELSEDFIITENVTSTKINSYHTTPRWGTVLEGWNTTVSSNLEENIYDFNIIATDEGEIYELSGSNYLLDNPTLTDTISYSYISVGYSTIDSQQLTRSSNNSLWCSIQENSVNDGVLAFSTYVYNKSGEFGSDTLTINLRYKTKKDSNWVYLTQNTTSDGTSTTIGNGVQKKKDWQLTLSPNTYIIEFNVKLNGIITSQTSMTIEAIGQSIREEFNIESISQNSYTFSDDLNTWITKNSWQSYDYIVTFRDFYTLPIINGDQFWKHEDNHGNYYGSTEETFVEYVVNEHFNIQKVYDNLLIMSDGTLPIRIELVNDNDNHVQILTPRTNDNIHLSDVYNVENEVRVMVKPTTNRIRDKYTRVKIVYSGKVKIRNIITYYRFSHA